MTDTELTSPGTKPQPLPTQWLYCFVCNQTHMMLLIHKSFKWATYRCPNCYADKSVLR